MIHRQCCDSLHGKDFTARELADWILNNWSKGSGKSVFSSAYLLQNLREEGFKIDTGRDKEVCEEALRILLREKRLSMQNPHFMGESFSVILVIE